jgi:hypothetical protein
MSEQDKQMILEQIKSIIAVDFDGCLHDGKYPNLGEPNMRAFSDLRMAQLAGSKIILWSCRQGLLLEMAVDYCLQYGVKFDAINTNLPEVIELFGYDTRKVYATEYWDDKAKIVRCAWKGVR